MSISPSNPPRTPKTDAHGADGKRHPYFEAYARLIVGHPGKVLVTLLLLLGVATWGASKLTINSNQLDLISQDLQEVKDVHRVIDMVGGAGYLMLGLRGEDEATLKAISDDIAAMLEADKEHVRFVTYKVPVEFIQQNMVLFVKTEDLLEGKKRINAFLRDQIRRASPFFFEIKKTEPLKLDLEDLIEKYSSVGKKSIRDDYYISKDRQVMLLLIKPKWDTNEIGKTHDFVQTLNGKLKAYGESNKFGLKFEESYDRAPKKGLITFGYTGSYKTSEDDSYAIEQSLQPVSLIAFGLILLITIAFFRRVAPTVIVLSGVVIGTLISLGFTYATVGQLNMVTSILGGILMGFGVDFGIHFIYRTRIELGLGKNFDDAIRDALINAGRPAFVAAIVTAGSFLVLVVSEFRGFSQFGFLACTGTILIGLTLFSWSPALLMLLGRFRPEWVPKLIGVTSLPTKNAAGGELRIPHPKLVLGICTGVVLLVCAFAVPWAGMDSPASPDLSLWERFKYGVRFNYNTRALMPDNFPSIIMQDEVNDRFQISSDPLAIYTKTRDEAKELFDELQKYKDTKYSTVDQVASIYTFVPPPDIAAANQKILQEWKEELSDIEVSALPPEMQEKADVFFKILDAKPFDVNGVPEIYASIFQHLPETKPENHGWLTFVYPAIDLFDGKAMMKFSDQVHTIKTDSGKEFRAAGLSILYSKLARIVLWDGKVTVVLAAIWILAMHFADFRNWKLALASVIPLGVGLAMMLGFLTLFGERLNFMNIIVLPILLGFGVSHGLYLLHRFLEGTSPVVALRSVGAAVASSTLTAIAGFGSLLAASHNGLKSMGIVACIGLTTTLLVSFTVLAAVLQLMHDERTGRKHGDDKKDDSRTAA